MEITYQTVPPEIEDYMLLFESTEWNEVYKATQEEIARAVRNSSITISAYLGSELVGFGRVVSDNVLYAVIYDVIVAPDHQMKGVGKCIVERLLQQCVDKGIRDIQLFSAKGTINFYEKLGFIERPNDAPGMKYEVAPTRPVG